MSDEPINLGDHDLLVATHTLQQVTIQRLEEHIKTNNQLMEVQRQELHNVAMQQVRLDGEIVSIKGMLSNLDDRLDKQEAKSTWMDIAGYVGALIAGAIAWFK